MSRSLLDDEARRDFLEVINEEADRLNHFVEDMVELARIEAGAINLAPPLEFGRRDRGDGARAG